MAELIFLHKANSYYAKMGCTWQFYLPADTLVQSSPALATTASSGFSDATQSLECYGTT